jgi:(4S)-4-hydroxy-5-phosphonooxypentane-2,3-dione isomerase
MHVVTVTFEAAPGCETELEEALVEQAKASRAEPGCVRFDVAADVAAKGRFFLYEIYLNPGEFETHLQTPHFLSFDRKVGPLMKRKQVDRWDLVDHGYSRRDCSPAE